MKLKLAAMILGSSMIVGLGVVSAAAATGVVFDSRTSVDGTSGCASQTTLLQVNGSDVVNRSDATCAP